jgi:hypothetical protein
VEQIARRAALLDLKLRTLQSQYPIYLIGGVDGCMGVEKKQHRGCMAVLCSIFEWRASILHVKSIEENMNLLIH